MTLALHYLFLFFGLEHKNKPLTFAQTLSFELPDPRKVLWHRVVQPARESPLLCKPIALLVRSIVPVALLEIAACLGAFVGMASCAADFLNWERADMKLPALYNGWGDLLLMVGSFGLIFLCEAVSHFTRFWRVRRIDRTTIITDYRGVPKFVLRRMLEIEDKANAQNAKVTFKLRSTSTDPIVSAKVIKQGRTEKFDFAVYLPKNETPLCE